MKTLILDLLTRLWPLEFAYVLTCYEHAMLIIAVKVLLVVVRAIMVTYFILIELIQTTSSAMP